MKSHLLFTALSLAVAGGVIAVTFLFCLYCKRQAEVYRSQGVDISAFDVAIGIRPAGTPGKK